MKNKIWFLGAFGFMMLTGFPLAAQINPDIDLKNSVVKVFVNANPPDFLRPWQSRGVSRSIGSGSVIAGNLVLTSAHVVDHQTFIQLKKNTGSKLYTAKVKAIGNDCDLALLTVEDPEFFKGTAPLPFGELPKLQDEVIVMGYPVGGDQLSVTEGVVSRVDMVVYSHSRLEMLGVQIDAAINPGNSGGPVIQNGKIVGVAFQGLQDAQNVGYMVPTPVIGHFLKDLEDGRYDGIPWLAEITEQAENEDLRRFQRLGVATEGVLITKMIPMSPAFGILKPGDILLAIDGTPIANDGTFEFRPNERLPYSHLIDRHQLGTEVRFKVQREGKSLDLAVTLTPYMPLVPWPSYFNRPTYFIYGGFVFTVLSGDLLLAIEENAKDRHWDVISREFIDLTYYAMGTGSLREKDREDLVVLLTVLPHEVNIGYQDIRAQVVDKVNGKTVRSFREFVEILRETRDEYTVIDTEEMSRIVLRDSGVREADQKILEKYNIAAAYSEDLAIPAGKNPSGITKKP